MAETTEQLEPLRNFEKWSETLRNFADWVGDAVPGAMDVDFLVERKGQFLVIEAKPWQSGVLVPYGQHKALYALSLEPNFRVYLAGEDEDVVHLCRYDLAPKPAYVRSSKSAWFAAELFVPTTKEQLSSLVRAWWKDASNDS